MVTVSAAKWNQMQKRIKGDDIDLHNRRTGPTPGAANSETCTFCSMKYHTVEKYFANPNSSVYNTERAISYRAKHPVNSTSSANVRMTRVLPPAEEELRSLTGDHSILNIIYLDGGGDCNILNYHHFHLFTRCESYDCGE